MAAPLAEAHVKKFYAYELGAVLFKPTVASVDQFRGSFNEALSCFVKGSNPEGRRPENQTAPLVAALHAADGADRSVEIVAQNENSIAKGRGVPRPIFYVVRSRAASRAK